MSIERIYYCDNPSCAEDHPGDGANPVHARTASPPPHLPVGFLHVRVGGSNGGEHHHFCGWECCMKYAATLPAPTIIPLDGEDGTDG